MTDIKNGVLVKERMSKLNLSAPIDREPMTRDEYFTAVLMEVGEPDADNSLIQPMYSNTYFDKTIKAMTRLARYGPPESLGYTDFLQWCYRQKEQAREEAER